jgi:hypothetical protein
MSGSSTVVSRSRAATLRVDFNDSDARLDGLLRLADDDSKRITTTNKGCNTETSVNPSW